MPFAFSYLYPTYITHTNKLADRTSTSLKIVIKYEMLIAALAFKVHALKRMP